MGNRKLEDALRRIEIDILSSETMSDLEESSCRLDSLVGAGLLSQKRANAIFDELEPNSIYYKSYKSQKEEVK